MRISDFDYDLPQDLIAQQPLPERDASRLLVLERASGRIGHHRFRELPSLLDPGDLLVVNRSRVFPARLLGRRAGGGAAEVLLVRRKPDGIWDALVRPGRRLRPGA
ncbi:MAG TPA: S-adenosylmethionine:tRNA ribosyltransferase-isomerase, partial [Vicinamibacteria bacterium]